MVARGGAALDDEGEALAVDAGGGDDDDDDCGGGGCDDSRR